MANTFVIPPQIEKQFRKPMIEAAEFSLSISLHFAQRKANQFCDSPIEAIFLVSFLLKTEFGFMEFPNLRSCYCIVADDGELNLEDLPPDTQEATLISCQRPIEGFRVDFAMRRMNKTGAGDIRKSPILIVECDGHDFHERTKEQAAQDKSRDRILTAAGYRVMRFTGSELWRDAYKCVSEVDDYLTTFDAV